jgi:hypothetical protein
VGADEIGGGGRECIECIPSAAYALRYTIGCCLLAKQRKHQAQQAKAKQTRRQRPSKKRCTVYCGCQGVIEWVWIQHAQAHLVPAAEGGVVHYNSSAPWRFKEASVYQFKIVFLTATRS